jgi:hypothetical protein
MMGFDIYNRCVVEEVDLEILGEGASNDFLSAADID